MNILYIGDVMGSPGRKILAKVLPRLRIQYDIDIVIAQAENVTHGKAMSKKHFVELSESGVDASTGGNHTFERTDTMQLVNDPLHPVIAPANVTGKHKTTFKAIATPKGDVAIVSLLGYTIPSGYNETTGNPLVCIDELLPKMQQLNPVAIVVNIHSDLSSEKVMMGHYLDGKVTAVVGDHWHTPTADQRVLPNGTAHTTDVGMCGALNSSLGVDIDVAIARWKGSTIKNKIVDAKELQFNAVLIKTKKNLILAKSVVRIQEFL